MTRRTLLLSLAASAPVLAQKKRKKKKGDDEHLGLLSGTVFDSNGRSLPGTKLTVTREDDPKVRLEGVSDGRGEFAFRTPAGPTPGDANSYKIAAEAKGYETVERVVDVYEAQRTNVNLLLSPAKK